MIKVNAQEAVQTTKMNVAINSASDSLTKGGSRPRNLLAMVDYCGYLQVKCMQVR